MEELLNAAPLRVMIVDDEYYFRKLLVHLVDWNAIGYEIACEAEDGLQALELAGKVPFHLILADINMPRMSGLEFVKELRKSDKDTKIIFLTSYGEFEYAKLAVTLGASGYLMKPVDETELEAALQEVHLQIGREQALKKQADLSLPLLSERFVRQLLYEEPAETPEAILNQARQYHLPTDDKAYAVIIVQIDDLHVRFEKEPDRRCCCTAVQEIAERKFQSLGSFCAVMNGLDDTIVILAGISEPADSVINGCCQQVRSDIESALQLHCTLAYGQMYEGLNQVHLSYSEAVSMLKQKFVEGGNCVIAYRETQEGHPKPAEQLQINRHEWLVALRHRDLPSIREKINELCRQLIDSRAGKETAIMSVMECFSIAAAVITERGEPLPVGWMTEEHPLFRQALKLETVEGMRQWMMAFFEEIVQNTLEGKDDAAKRSDIVRKALAFVREHFSNEGLTLQLTAKELFVNPSYLSHLFKKETGQSFIEYLSDVRLEHAMELLKTSPDKMSDIAFRVGYSDPYYFSKCFKKKYGIAPKKFNA